MNDRRSIFRSRPIEDASVFGFLLVLAAACSSPSNDDPRADSDAGNALPAQLDAGLATRYDDGGYALPSSAILPWKEGNSWTYRVTDNGVVTTKVVTIGALEAVGGTGVNKDRLASKVVTRKGPTDQTISWQVEDQGGARVIRLREQSFGAKTGLLQLDEFFDPYKLHVDGTPAHSVAGASWVETYQDEKNAPDGGSTTTTSSDAWSVDAVNQAVTVPAGTFNSTVFIKGGGKTYWYTVGIGKIKETGGQTEELVSYSLTP